MNGEQCTLDMHKYMSVEEDDKYWGRLRDEFAMAALAGTLGHPKSSGAPIDHATWAYQVADAMLEARLK